ncbi:tetratricopeptide repeat-containing sensor histidine kinase [Pedobacter glucosidilyticus]|uniref:tetratricopeptide repeat-containing sensor histidine kinase n=1 Tax=Pedobacter glucosidilyticus TaxID=1122941 RepID=UPI00047ABCAE|nr:tetratricopeptide repeat-containing sensor histidine kinase [Pedobacter glucosidilyticus]
MRDITNFKTFINFFQTSCKIHRLLYAFLFLIIGLKHNYAFDLRKDTTSIHQLIKETYSDKKIQIEKLELTHLILNLSKKNNFTYGLFKGYTIKGNILLDSYQYQSALNNYKLAKTQAQLLKNNSYLTDALFNIAYCYQSLDSTKKSIINYQQALVLGKKDSSLLAAIHTNLGVIYDYQGDYGKAINHYLESYNLNKLLKNQQDLGTSLSNLGQLFTTLKMYDKAIYYLKKSEKIATSSKDTATLCYAYENLGANYLSKNELLKARFYLEKSLELAKKVKLQEFEIISLNYSHLGELHVKTQTFEQAKTYLDTAYKIAITKHLNYHKAFALTQQVNLLNKLNKLNDAKLTGEKALLVCDSLNQKPLKIILLQYLKETYYQQGLYAKAFETQEQALQLEKSLKLEENLKQVTVLMATRDFDKKTQVKKLIKEQEKKALESKIETQRITLSLVIVILIILAFFGINSYKNHQLQKKINDDLAKKNHEIELSRVELNKQSEAFALLNKHKDQIFTIISHDLRKPMTHLSSVLELLENNILEADDFKTLIPEISKNVKDTSEVLDSLLFWAKSQLKGFNLKITEQNLYNFINSKIESLIPFANEKNIRILNQINPQVSIKLDAMLSMIVLRNLVFNAIKFSYEHKQIIIQMEENTDDYEIKVIDHGIGMSPVQVQNLFTIKNKSTLGTHQERGTGLGLYFCNDIVSKFGGKFKVESAVGRGTIISFTIPKYA